MSTPHLHQHHDHSAPNHHAHHDAFRGLRGLVAALSMVGGRQSDADLAMRLGELQPEDRVVDVGAGPGSAARVAARAGATVTAVDPATVMRRIGRLLTRSSRVRYVDGTAEALPVADDAADVVWSIATVHHWKDIEAGVAEVRRVLRPGGRFVAIEGETTADATGLRSHGWTPAQADAFASACRAAGLVDVRVEHGTTHRGDALAVVARTPN